MQASLSLTVGRQNVLNANQRLHHQAQAKIVKILRHAGYINARAQNLPTFTSANFLVHVAYPDRRKRDVLNLYPTAKAIIDGMVDAGVLADDNDDFLTGPDMRRAAPRLSGIPGVFTFTFTITETT